MTCLLCGQHLKNNLTFSSLLLLKKEESLLCSECFLNFEKIGEEHCPNCYKIGVSTSCQECQLWCKEGIDVYHEAIFTYNEAMKDYFSRYKFDGDYLLRKIFVSILRERLKKYKEFQFLIIPLSSERFSKRGFNQVEGLIEATGLSYHDFWEKMTRKQVLQKIVQSDWPRNFHFLLKLVSRFPRRFF